MAGLVPAIHVFRLRGLQDVDARDKRGHDGSIKLQTRSRRMTALPDRRIVVSALGITQIFAWGSTFYLPAALAPLIARDTGWPYDVTVGGVSVALLFAGLASPRVGRLIAEKGGRPVLAIGALLLAAGLVGVGMSSSIAWYLASWLVIGLGMSASLYDAAFSTLGRTYGLRSRTAITAVTLFGGFASTVCWPLSAFLAARFGWRGACFTYAAIQIAVALPLHLFALPSATETNIARTASPPVGLRRDEYMTFALLAAVLTLGASILSMVGTQLLPLLTARGFAMSAAVAFGAIVGPAQVGARVVELLIGSRYDPVWTIVASTVLVAIAALMLLSDFSIVALAIAFYGAGNGVGSVARGTVPLALFGAKRYPVLMGQLAFPLLLAMALSPYFGALAFQNGGADMTLALLTATALLNVVLAAVLRLTTWRR
jgi:predicted MFS family arabinose efflux permease